MCCGVSSHAISEMVSPRHLALVIAAVAVLGLGVYLFFEVRSTPAQAQVAPLASHSVAAAASPTHEEKSPEPTTTAPRTAPQPLAASHGEDPKPAVPEEPGVEGPVEGPRLGGGTKLEMLMSEANKAYDEQDFERARAIAGKLLVKQPENVRMLRIMVSSSCIQGDSAVAQQYYDKLPKADREQMKTRCDRYGVTVRDP